MRVILYLVFILSGAAGLMYESIWSRYLGLFVGHSAYAQIIVLTIFLGGMSLGAVLVGQRSERLRQPLLWYAAVEGAVGTIGLVFHGAFQWTTHVAYDVIFPAVPGGATLMVLKWVIASLLILPQSILLGMTFPLMSAGVLRIARERPGRVLALLYFANSLGAAAGVLVAGFVLIARWGLPGTLAWAATLNMIVALVTLAAVRLRGLVTPGIADAIVPDGPREVAESAESAESNEPAGDVVTLPVPRLWRLLLLLSFGTAVASFIYEISWIRMLSLVLGSATHSFELMLSAFILGLALGALWVHGAADRFRDPIRALGVVQWLMGFAALATLPLYLRSFAWSASLYQALDFTDQGYTLYSIARYAFCLAVMLPSTFFAGITLPLITRTLLVAGNGAFHDRWPQRRRSQADNGAATGHETAYKGERAVGWVYGINTLGSIVGVVLASLVLLPWMGLKTLLIEGAVIDMALGVMLLRVSAGNSPRRMRLVYASVVALVAAVSFATLRTTFDRDVLMSGVYRYGKLPEPGERQIVFYQDGRTASVAVGESATGGMTYITTNGKPDASLDAHWLQPDTVTTRRPLDGDVSTQVLLPMITLAHAPDARSVAVVGHGSGMTSHLLLGSPRVERLATIEIEPQMIRGSRYFFPANRRVFDDPRSHSVLDDAKSYFASERRTYDIILSEPSNPWVSGVAGLFTTEFYARVKGYLSPTGVFGQWLHLYEIDDGLVFDVLAAIHQNFPSYEVFLTANSDILIVASTQPALRVPDWSVFSLPLIARDLAHTLPITPDQMESTRLISREALAPLLDHWPTPNSDYYPVLDLGAERTRFLRHTAIGLMGLGSDRFDIVAAMYGHRRGFSRDVPASVPGVTRMRALAIGAALRSRRAPNALDTLAELDLSAPLYRRWRFESAMAAGHAPGDWQLWLTDMLTVEDDLHRGTAGAADETFYAPVMAYVERSGAPATIRETVTFAHALARWDFAAASRAADSLLAPARAGHVPLSVDELRAGAVVAKLRLGDVEGARQYLVALGRVSKLPASDARVLLLAAYVREAGKRATELGAP